MPNSNYLCSLFDKAKHISDSRYKSFLRTLPVLGFSTLLAACGGDSSNEVGSQDVDTGNFQAHITVTATADNLANVETRLVWVPDETFIVRLAGGDSLSATVDGETKELETSPDNSDPIYIASFTDGSSEAEYQISLERVGPPDFSDEWFPEEWIDESELERFSDYEVSAPNNLVTLPMAFTLNADQEFVSNLNDEVVLTWDADSNGDEMSLAFTTRCPEDPDQDGIIFEGDLDISGDPGTATVQVNDLIPESSNAEACAVTLKVQRLRFGDADEALSDGSILRGIQQRSVTVRYLPGSV